MMDIIFVEQFAAYTVAFARWNFWNRRRFIRMGKCDSYTGILKMILIYSYNSIKHACTLHDVMCRPY